MANDDFIDTGGVSGKAYSRRPYKSVIPKDDIEIEKYQQKIAAIPKKQRALYKEYVKVLVARINREIYDRFKNTAGIDFVPIYCYYDARTKTIRCKVRDDFINSFFKVELSFGEWLSKKRRFKKRRKLEAYLNPNPTGKQGKDFFRKSPHLKEDKKEYIKEMEEQGKFNEFSNVPRRAKTRQGQFIMKGVESYPMYKSPLHQGVPFGKIVKRKGKEFEVFQAFNKPIDSKALKELFDPDNEDVLWGGDSFVRYIKARGVSPEIYNKVMKKVMEKMWDDFSQIDTRELTESGLQQYSIDARNEQPIKFPNIERIKDWFLKEGIYNVDRRGDVANHYYTIERFRNLKSNTQRMNFIDRAVFLIANSIYMKRSGIEPYTKKGTKRKYAGKKASIKTAKRYKKFSKQRKKYSTERTKKYDEWRQNNRRDAANFKRQDTRRRRQS